MNYKKHVKYLLKSIRKAFEISDSLEEYEKICQCIYFLIAGLIMQLLDV